LIALLERLLRLLLLLLIVHVDIWIGQLLNLLHLLVIAVVSLVKIDVVAEAFVTATAVDVTRTTFSTHLFKYV
jgi:hypothetical protein